MPSRFPPRAHVAVRKAIERAGTTETWAVLRELYKVAQASRKRTPEGHMKEIWEIETTRDVMDLIKEVLEGSHNGA